MDAVVVGLHRHASRRNRDRVCRLQTFGGMVALIGVPVIHASHAALRGAVGGPAQTHPVAAERDCDGIVIFVERNIVLFGVAAVALPRRLVGGVDIQVAFLISVRLCHRIIAVAAVSRRLGALRVAPRAALVVIEIERIPIIAYGGAQIQNAFIGGVDFL